MVVYPVRGVFETPKFSWKEKWGKDGRKAQSAGEFANNSAFSSSMRSIWCRIWLKTRAKSKIRICHNQSTMFRSIGTLISILCIIWMEDVTHRGLGNALRFRVHRERKKRNFDVSSWFDKSRSIRHCEHLSFFAFSHGSLPATYPQNPCRAETFFFLTEKNLLGLKTKDNGR